MKLLIVTQAVDSNDSNLGFFHRWIEEFAKHCEAVIVICLREGAHTLPKNVTVLSLGKERGVSRPLRAVRFLTYIYKYRNSYDAVFVHMNPEYIVLGGFLWRRWRKRTSLWYAHKSVTPHLRRAVRLVDRVFTVSKDSFRVPTPKLCIVGHGIDTELFTLAIHLESTQMRIVTVGRIAESKHILEMIAVLDVLHAQGEHFTFTIVGEAITEREERYRARVQEELRKRPYEKETRFLGPVPHSQLPEVLHGQDLFFNFGGTGNMDKAGLEALAAGVPVFSTNEAFEQLLAPFGLYVGSMHPQAVVDALMKFLNLPNRPGVVSTLHNKVVAEHSLSALIPKILNELA